MLYKYVLVYRVNIPVSYDEDYKTYNDKIIIHK